MFIQAGTCACSETAPFRIQMNVSVAEVQTNARRQLLCSFCIVCRRGVTFLHAFSFDSLVARPDAVSPHPVRLIGLFMCSSGASALPNLAGLSFQDYIAVCEFVCSEM